MSTQFTSVLAPRRCTYILPLLSIPSLFVVPGNECLCVRLCLYPARGPLEAAVGGEDTYEDLDRAKSMELQTHPLQASKSTDSKASCTVVSQKNSVVAHASIGRTNSEPARMDLDPPALPLMRSSDVGDAPFRNGVQQPITESLPPEVMSRNTSKHSVVQLNATSDMHPPTTWTPSVTAVEDEDDEPPPALPPKTAEAELIYGENIPMSNKNTLASCSTTAIPTTPAPLSSASSLAPSRSNPSMQRITAPTVRRAPSIKSTSSDVEDAPDLPPKTAEAEMLYDYCDGVKQNPPPGKYDKVLLQHMLKL